MDGENNGLNPIEMDDLGGCFPRFVGKHLYGYIFHLTVKTLEPHLPAREKILPTSEK